MQFNIHNRFTGAVQFTAEIDCDGAELTSVKIGLAVKWAILVGASLVGASLDGARLVGARLDRARLVGASLVGARLDGQWIIQGATRSDGYSFFLQKLKDDSEPMVKAGCRYFTLAQAQQHWEKTRKGQPLLDETREIVRCMVNIAHVRGYMKDGK